MTPTLRDASNTAAHRKSDAGRIEPETLTEPAPRVVFWGTYDLGKPRNRILIDGLRKNGVEIIECSANIWADIEDKSALSQAGVGRRAWRWVRWLGSYPRLLWRYLRLPTHDIVLIGYLGQLDVVVIWPFMKLLRKPLVWDVFLSLHHMLVDDRELLSPRDPRARLLFAWEWCAMRLPDRLLTDTAAHGALLKDRFGVQSGRLDSVLVGVEDDKFPAPPLAPRRVSTAYRVLFYGQFIPFHGIEIIVEAARLCREESILWHVIGDGQQGERCRQLLASDKLLARVSWTRWVPYNQLATEIHRADVCLGVFGARDKTHRVIPNKVYQVLAAGRALITADTPAVRELLEPGPGIILVPPGEPLALAEAVLDMRQRCPVSAAADLARYRERITPSAVCRPLADMLRALRQAQEGPLTSRRTKGHGRGV